MEKQRYRMTFKCGCGEVFRKLTTDPNLMVTGCPACKKKNKKTQFFRRGDGPVPSTEKYAVAPPPRPVPNVIYKCKDCSAIARVFEEIGETALTQCPACDSPNIQYRGHISYNQTNESKIQTKAIDVTADIVMQDHKLGDLKDNVRVGESMAPKLDPPRQAVADNMFGNRKRQMYALDVGKGRPTPIDGGMNMGRITRSAMAGGLRAPGVDPVARLRPENKPNVTIVAGDGINGAKAR